MPRYARNGIGFVLLAYVCAGPAPADDRAVLPVPIRPPSNAVTPAVFIDSDTFPLTLLGSVEYSQPDHLAFGDTDHDGANELALTNQAVSYSIWEHRGNNVYSLEATGPSLFTNAVGDVDQDGRAEIIGQTSGYVQVFESVDAFTHPSQLVWSSPYLSNVAGYTAIGDTDRDGHMEIIHSINSLSGSTSHLAIFESTGDNTLTQVFNGTVSGPSATGVKLIADLDGDGNLEIALCGIDGWLHVFESSSNDTWILTAREWTALFNAYTVVGGQDTDGNGRPEIFVTGDEMSMITTRIYESCGDNTFVKVGSLALDEGLGPASAAVCNVDGVGPEEYLLRSGPGIRVFRASAPGRMATAGPR